MTLLVYQLVQDYLPLDRKQNAKGWLNFNSVCCHHRGHNQDKKCRGSLLASANEITYNCYNCGFAAKYAGSIITQKFKTFLHYLNVPQEKILQADLEILDKKNKGELDTSTSNYEWFKIEQFEEVELPKNAKSLQSWLNDDYKSTDLSLVLNYLTSRGKAVATSHQYYWTPDTKWNLNKRLIIPFYYNNKIVGWTGRYAGTPPDDTPRYFNSQLSEGYLFNGDILFNRSRRYVLITEGPFDAIAIDGVAALGSTLSQSQISWLNSFGIEKIVVPDRQKKNQDLIDVAIEQNWSVSFPDWEDHIKDAAQASERYGKLYTIYTIIRSKETTNLKINYKRQLFKG